MKDLILEADDIRIDRDMDVDLDIGQEITCYVETWFDVDSKFQIDTTDNDNIQFNVYAIYNPFEDTLRIECVIDDGKKDQYFDYNPTVEEAHMFKEKITEKISEMYGLTPQEFCNEFVSESQTIGGII